MGFINVAERTINAKLVYYGVGAGGKTTSLQQVHGIEDIIDALGIGHAARRSRVQ